MKKLTKAIVTVFLISAGTVYAESANHLARHPSHYFSDTIYVMQHIQSKLDNAKFIIFSLQNISEIKTLPEEQKKMLENVYVISARTGEIVYSQIEAPEVSDKGHTPLADTLVKTRQDALAIHGKAPDGVAIADATIKSWRADESRIIYDIGEYFTTVAVSKDREFYILAVSDIYFVTN